MSNGGWFTPNDIIKDLKKAMGKQVLSNVEGSVLVGGQPPPQQYNLLDDEAELQLLRLCGASEPDAGEGPIKPDLAGITRMLRMVDELSEKEPELEHVKTKEPSKDVLTISKLNPNVNEFIPNFNLSNGKTTNTIKETVTNATEILKVVEESVPKNIVKADDCNTLTLSVKAVPNSIVITDNSDTLVLSERRIDTNQLNKKEIKEMREKLKAKISETSKNTCAKVKRERNLAITTLLKLHCHSPKVPVEQKPKLISPAYFEKYPTDKSPKNGVIGKSIETQSTEKLCSTQDFLVDNDPSLEASTDLLQNGITSDLKKTIEGTSASTIAASVDKVQKWLCDSGDAISCTSTEQPEVTVKDDGLDEKSNVSKTNGHSEPSSKPRGFPYLGPITFKRKAGRSKPESPTSSSSNDQAKHENGKTVECAVYVPSPYATELNKKYQERSNKVRNSSRQLDLYKLIEEKLKAKEEEIKLKLEKAKSETCPEG